eukprot:598858-Rhodomonas_salina.1
MITCFTSREASPRKKENSKTRKKTLQIGKFNGSELHGKDYVTISSFPPQPNLEFGKSGIWPAIWPDSRSQIHTDSQNRCPYPVPGYPPAGTSGGFVVLLRPSGK